MDGHFVPNLTVGPLVVRALRPIITGTLDVHLMIEQPERLIPAFAQAGADLMTVHVEAALHLHRTIRQIKELGCKAGVALNPDTPLAILDDILPELELDLVLVMSVDPGFGAQQYSPPAPPRSPTCAAPSTSAAWPASSSRSTAASRPTTSPRSPPPAPPA